MTGPAPLPLPPVSLPRSGWWEMRAAGEPAATHRILAAWPEAPPPAAGYPVLLLLDGQAGFATAAEAAASLAHRPRDAAAGLVIGLGHGGAAPLDPAARLRDYTPAIPGGPEGSGGAAAFLHFLEHALLPELARRWPVDPARLALFGHSLGGLFAVHALLRRPGLFARLIAASPSLWWGEGALLAEAEAFAAAPPPTAAGTALLVTTGGLEAAPDAASASTDPRAALRAGRDMAGRARALVATLRAGGLTAGHVEFAGEDHGSVRSAAIARALRFAFAPSPLLPEPAR
ncbi:alpha/beta hydrolase [Pseudoroseomonas cervicalis]|uniref:alpha/beta hydrolase n=1 Tax=Teichococcus cervicalis TaxID=204525 RepID=UPI0027836EB6|nr:alpha/beta hydrolase-fold protein [Pseudoroseomonas cervicalis]MDQ1078077.1 putative alpha/beta superfamily hydrolase [Pseudoroseomonas cervicalis]